jgi:hypothetical protein
VVRSQLSEGRILTRRKRRNEEPIRDLKKDGGSGYPSVAIQLERHRHHLAFLFGKFFARVMRDLLDFRILEHRDVEIYRFFRLIIEPEHWSDFLHAS